MKKILSFLPYLDRSTVCTRTTNTHDASLRFVERHGSGIFRDVNELTNSLASHDR